MLSSYPVNVSIPGRKQNCFTKSWYNISPFIEYSWNLDKIFCFACSLFGSDIVCSEDMWQNEGLNQWDKMKGRGKQKKGTIEIHFTSNAHKQIIQKYHSFLKKSSHVDVKINERWKKKVALEKEGKLPNRKIIHVLLDWCCYLCRQCLAFRGSKDELERNFSQSLHLLARWVPIIEYWISSCHLRLYKVTYLSKNSQNEYINLIGDEVSKLIAEEIISAKFLAVMANTTPDKSHRNQISLVNEFTEKVLWLFGKLHISSYGIWFQCYDTTSSMSGKYNGGQIKLSEFLGLLIPNILRMGHKKNLCVEHSSEELRMIEGFFTSPQNLYNFLTKSTSRFDIYMEKVEELQEGLSSSVTRWIGCVESI